MRGDQEIKPLIYNAFAQADINLTKSTLLTAASSANFIEYQVYDMMAKTQTHVNASSYKRFTPIITPRVGINQVIKGLFSVYANLSTGFSPPSTSQILITEFGQVNLDLKPETGISYEIGSKGDLFKKVLNYEIAGYLMDVTNKLITQNFVQAEVHQHIRLLQMQVKYAIKVSKQKYLMHTYPKNQR